MGHLTLGNLKCLLALFALTRCVNIIKGDGLCFILGMTLTNSNCFLVFREVFELCSGLYAVLCVLMNLS